MLNKPTHGSQPIKNEQSGCKPTQLERMNKSIQQFKDYFDDQFPCDTDDSCGDNMNDLDRTRWSQYESLIALSRILTAAKVSTVDELVDMFKCVREQTKPSVCVLDFLFKKGINSDTTIGIEGDYPITEILEEYANLQPKSHRPLSPEDIKRAAQEFRKEHLFSSAFIADVHSFIAGANFAKQPHSNEVDEPIYCNCETPTLGTNLTRCGTCGEWFKRIV